MPPWLAVQRRPLLQHQQLGRALGSHQERNSSRESAHQMPTALRLAAASKAGNVLRSFLPKKETADAASVTPSQMPDRLRTIQVPTAVVPLSKLSQAVIRLRLLLLPSCPALLARPQTPEHNSSLGPAPRMLIVPPLAVGSSRASVRAR